MDSSANRLWCCLEGQQEKEYTNVCAAWVPLGAGHLAGDVQRSHAALARSRMICKEALQSAALKSIVQLKFCKKLPVGTLPPLKSNTAKLRVEYRARLDSCGGSQAWGSRDDDVPVAGSTGKLLVPRIAGLL